MENSEDKPTFPFVIKGWLLNDILNNHKNGVYIDKKLIKHYETFRINIYYLKDWNISIKKEETNYEDKYTITFTSPDGDKFVCYNKRYSALTDWNFEEGKKVRFKYIDDGIGTTN